MAPRAQVGAEADYEIVGHTHTSRPPKKYAPGTAVGWEDLERTLALNEFFFLRGKLMHRGFLGNQSFLRHACTNGLLRTAVVRYSYVEWLREELDVCNSSLGIAPIKAITVWKADDGSIWTKEDEALARDQIVARVAGIEQELGMAPRPTRGGFGDGVGFLQHPAGTRDLLLDKLRELGAHRDSDGPIGRLLHRLWCIDGQDREWGQRYFALHPERGKQVSLEPGHV